MEIQGLCLSPESNDMQNAIKVNIKFDCSYLSYYSDYYEEIVSPVYFPQRGTCVAQNQ